MKKFEKAYIGKGTKHETLPIITVVLKMDDADEHIFDMDGQRFLKFEVALMKSEDNYGRTHTAYCSKMVEVPEPAAKKKRTPKPKPEPELIPAGDDDLPF